MLGHVVYTILSANEEESDSKTLERIREEFRSASLAIQNGEEIIRRLGMNVSEFPTTKGPTRGKYLFDGETADEKLKQGKDESDSVLNKNRIDTDDASLADDDIIGEIIEEAKIEEAKQDTVNPLDQASRN